MTDLSNLQTNLMLKPCSFCACRREENCYVYFQRLDTSPMDTNNAFLCVFDVFMG